MIDNIITYDVYKKEGTVSRKINADPGAAGLLRF